MIRNLEKLCCELRKFVMDEWLAVSKIPYCESYVANALTNSRELTDEREDM